MPLKNIRKKILRIFLILIVVAGIPLLASWIYIAQPIIFKSNMKTVAAMEPDRLKAHVRMLSETFNPRDEAHPVNLDRVAEYISSVLREAGGGISEQPFEVNEKEYRNVIARFGPDTDEIIIVGAHYDAAGITPGADDNASAVAGLLELGRLLKNHTLSLGVHLVAYTLEEPPYFGTEHMGSAIHAASIKQKGTRVRIMICLEMIGYYTDTPGSQKYPVPALRLAYPSTGDFIAVVGKLGQRSTVRRVKKAMQGASPLPVYSINAPRIVPGIDFSDHRNYWNRGYKAVMITDTAFYRNPNYHALRDTWDTLDYQRLAMAVKGVYAAVLEFSRDP